MGDRAAVGVVRATRGEHEAVVPALRVGQPDPVAGAGEVVLALEWGGICGSDISYWRHGGTGTAVLVDPLVLGHEVAGRVDEVGPDVTGVEVGQPNSIEDYSSMGSNKTK